MKYIATVYEIMKFSKQCLRLGEGGMRNFEKPTLTEGLIPSQQPCTSPFGSGHLCPLLHSAGLWVDMEVTYSGSLQMTLETKMNLYKLGKEALGEESGKAEDGREG